MDCNEVVKGAEALKKMPPVCDEEDNTKYAPRQCGSDGSFKVMVFSFLLGVQCTVHYMHIMHIP
jgi:hypothetical protein